MVGHWDHVTIFKASIIINRQLLDYPSAMVQGGRTLSDGRGMKDLDAFAKKAPVGNKGCKCAKSSVYRLFFLLVASVLILLHPP